MKALRVLSGFSFLAIACATPLIGAYAYSECGEWIRVANGMFLGFAGMLTIVLCGLTGLILLYDHNGTTPTQDR